MKEKSFTYNNLIFKIYSQVYDPAEDSFLLLESIDVKKDDFLLEIGCGCGIIGLVCAEKGTRVVCTDVNPYAVKNTEENYNINKDKIKGFFEVRKGDMFSVIKKDEIFDVIIFNPPYLPTRKEELIGLDGWYDKALDGGVDGLKSTKCFLDGLSNYLKKDGRAYFVFSSLSDKSKLESILIKNKFKKEILKSCFFDDERLDIYCVYI